MSKSPQEDAYEPPWGADGWPKTTANGLDEGDILLIHSMLELTPHERLEALTQFVNGMKDIQLAKRIRPG